MSDVPQNGVQESAETLVSGEKAATEQERQATFGYNEQGYFFLQVPKEMGIPVIIHTLMRAVHFFNVRMDMSEIERQKKSIIPPQRGFRGFNLFKK